MFGLGSGSNICENQMSCEPTTAIFAPALCIGDEGDQGSVRTYGLRRAKRLKPPALRGTACCASECRMQPNEGDRAP